MVILVDLGTGKFLESADAVRPMSGAAADNIANGKWAWKTPPNEKQEYLKWNSGNQSIDVDTSKKTQMENAIAATQVRRLRIKGYNDATASNGEKSQFIKDVQAELLNLLGMT